VTTGTKSTITTNTLYKTCLELDANHNYRTDCKFIGDVGRSFIDTDEPE